MIGVEFAVDFIRQDFHRNGDVRQRVVPQNGFHVVDRFDFFGQLCHVPPGHILHNDEGERTLSEVLQERFLPLDRVHVAGQVVQHIVVDAGVDHSEHAGNEQQQSDDQNGNAASDDRF